MRVTIRLVDGSNVRNMHSDMSLSQVRWPSSLACVQC